MDRISSTPVIRRRKVKAFRARGDIYNWLRAHSAEVTRRLASGEMTWPTLCAEMARHGVVDRDQKEPTPNAAIRVWQRVTRDLEENGEAEAAKPRPARTNLPSRMPKDWRPQELTPPAALPALAGPTAGAKAPYDPDKAMAHLKRIMNERSGRRT